MQFYDPNDKKNGIRLILDVIKNYGPISKREIQEKTNLSWGHISQVTKNFLKDGYIEIREKELTAGRARELLDISRTNNYFIGIDLTNSRMRMVVTNMKGTVIEENRHNWMIKEATKVIDELFEKLDEIIEKYSKNNILGIGFGLKGVVDSEKGESVYMAGIENWNNIPIKKLIEEQYDIETVVQHDPDCLMYSECHLGKLRNQDVRNAFLVTYNYDNGIGMSIMINGEIYSGHQSKAGEIGFTIIDITEERGLEILERYVGDRSIEAGEEKVMEYVARAIATANSLLSPEVIVLHLDEEEKRDKIIERVEKYLKKYSYNKDVRVFVSGQNKNAKAIGAALHIIENKIKQLV